MANSNFYANIGVNAGFTRSQSSSDSHTEGAAVTTLKPMNENSSITYSNVNNITYQGTQAQGGTFIYNNVANIQKEAVELRNSYSSESSGFGAGVSAGIGSNGQIKPNGISGNISANRSNQNTVETIYANGNFKNVNEVHNNTGSMTLSGFNQEGGKVTGNIGKLVVESRQNTSTTTGSSSGIGIGISANGMPSSVNISGSRTNGNREFVDTQSTFIIGEGSNLHVGTAENTGAIIGKQSDNNTTFKIDNYVGKNLYNEDTMTTTGGSIGASLGGKPKITSAGFNQDSRDKQGITRNTVAGNVEIGQSSGDEINRDLGKANEITKDSHRSTNINVEPQVIEYISNPTKFKEDLEVAILEGNEKLNLIIEKLSNEYNIENINNQIEQKELIDIVKKANEGIELTIKEQKIYNFYLKTNELYFEYVDNKLEDIKKMINLDKINNELAEKDKLYTIDELGNKNLSFENINRYLYNYINKNAIKLKEGYEEGEILIAAMYSLIYEEKIKKNQEYQNFKTDWITKSIVNFFRDKDLVRKVNKNFDTQTASKEEKKEWDTKVYNYTKEAVEGTLEKYLYQNYPAGIKFKNLNRDIPNITEDGKWIYPELKERGEYTGGYVPYYNIVELEDVSTGNRSVLYHEINHGIQAFLGSNYFQLGNKGYNDELVDVGRWFNLNNYHMPRPKSKNDNSNNSKYYPYNLRELDSMDIVNPTDKASNGLFKEIENLIRKKEN